MAADDAAATAPPAPSSAPEPAPCRRLLTTTDVFLLRLSRLLSTPSGTDSLLCTLSYTLTFVAAHTRTYVSARLERFAAALAINATGALLPGETLIATLPPSSRLVRLSRATDSMTKLSGVVSDFRVFVRLWALLDIYTWARGRVVGRQWEREKGLRPARVSLGEVAASAAFQALENGAYLADKGVLNGEWWTGEKGKRRIVRLGWVWAKEDEEEQLSEEDKKAKALAWWKQMISNIAWAPMTLHWSTEEGFISDAWVVPCGIVAGVWGCTTSGRPRLCKSKGLEIAGKGKSSDVV
ncbi:hypothetical protein IWZ01DRAFT_542521 [Phyllosticta capitalensis]